MQNVAYAANWRLITLHNRRANLRKFGPNFLVLIYFTSPRAEYNAVDKARRGPCFYDAEPLQKYVWRANKSRKQHPTFSHSPPSTIANSCRHRADASLRSSRADTLDAEAILRPAYIL